MELCQASTLYENPILDETELGQSRKKMKKKKVIQEAEEEEEEEEEREEEGEEEERQPTIRATGVSRATSGVIESFVGTTKPYI